MIECGGRCGRDDASPRHGRNDRVAAISRVYSNYSSRNNNASAFYRGVQLSYRHYLCIVVIPSNENREHCYVHLSPRFPL